MADAEKKTKREKLLEKEEKKREKRIMKEKSKQYDGGFTARCGKKAKIPSFRNCAESLRSGRCSATWTITRFLKI